MSRVEEILEKDRYIDLIIRTNKDGVFVAVLTGNDGDLVNECAGVDITDALDTLEQSALVGKLWEHLRSGNDSEDFDDEELP